MWHECPWLSMRQPPHYGFQQWTRIHTGSCKRPRNTKCVMGIFRLPLWFGHWFRLDCHLVGDCRMDNHATSSIFISIKGFRRQRPIILLYYLYGQLLGACCCYGLILDQYELYRVIRMETNVFNIKVIKMIYSNSERVAWTKVHHHGTYHIRNVVCFQYLRLVFMCLNFIYVY